jgi:hypothetical protein
VPSYEIGDKSPGGPFSPVFALSVRPLGNVALEDHVHGTVAEQSMPLAVSVSGPYAPPTPSVIKPCGITDGLAAITGAATTTAVEPLLPACDASPPYVAGIV